MSIPIASLGFPRIGLRRELKKSLEAYWTGKIGEERLQTDLPSNDFSLYDHVLDTTAMLGAVPPSYGWTGGDVALDVYFAMARGSTSAPALEMTKWFDTNYHYIVPTFVKDQSFSLASNKIVDEYTEARDLGYQTHPVLLGPISYLLLSKSPNGTDPLALLPDL